MQKSLILGLAVAVGCGCTPETNKAAAVPHLVRLNPDATINSWPLSTTRGRISVESGCISVSRVEEPITHAALIFPPSFKLRELDQGWGIVNRHGDIWGQVGDTKKIDGAIIAAHDVVTRYVTAGDRERCPGPYWLVKPDDPLDLAPRNQSAAPINR